MTNCNQCSKEIGSPKLTGELCARCYFKQLNQASNQSNEAAEGRLELPIENKIDNPTEQSKLSIEKSKSIEKKYCQSCLERYGISYKLATREWSSNYFICDDCFEPLVNSIMNHEAGRIEELTRTINTSNSNMPVLSLLYEALAIPVELQFVKSDEVLNNRDQIFNHHAGLLVNKEIKEIVEKIEEYSVLLFQIKLAIEPMQDYINRVKRDEREKKNLTGLADSVREVTKTSSVKKSKDEKMAKVLGMTIEKYIEMTKKAKEMEFNKIIGS